MKKLLLLGALLSSIVLVGCETPPSEEETKKVEEKGVVKEEKVDEGYGNFSKQFVDKIATELKSKGYFVKTSMRRGEGEFSKNMTYTLTIYINPDNPFKRYGEFVFSNKYVTMGEPELQLIINCYIDRKIDLGCLTKEMDPEGYKILETVWFNLGLSEKELNRLIKHLREKKQYKLVSQDGQSIVVSVSPGAFNDRLDYVSITFRPSSQ